jgi:IS605 OrfB family transposase
MENKLTVIIKLNPTKEQSRLVDIACSEYINVVNTLVSEMVESKETTKKTSKDITASLSSSVKNQAIRDSKSVFQKVKKSKYKIIPVLKKPVCIWNNQSYSIDDSTISIPFLIDSKSKRVIIRANINDRAKELLINKHGTLRITKKNNKYIAQVSVTIPNKENNNSRVMGVDLGLKVPAVAYSNNEKLKFFGNGRENKYIRRKFATRKKRLGKAKKLKTIKKISNKEQRIMNDRDHKVSKQIVNFAIKNNVSVIKLEKLTNIRNTTRTSRKNNKSLHTWSFYRLASYIEYKANLEGIKVKYVDPRYTSQNCPSCGTRNKAKDRKYKCRCGYVKHRDLVGAINIAKTVIDGKSLSA